MSYDELKRVVASNPLFVSVFASNKEFGMCCVDLQSVTWVRSQPHPANASASVQVLDQYVAICAPPPANSSSAQQLAWCRSHEQQAASRLGQIRVVLTLEDFGGASSANVVQTAASAASNAVASTTSGNLAQPVSSAAVGATASVTPRSPAISASVASTSDATASVASASGASRASLEYQAAWELEMWKRSEQAAFEARLRDIETQRVRELESEFAKADAKRQEQLARKQAELVVLEQKNKSFFQDLEVQVRYLCLYGWYFTVTVSANARL